MAEDTKVSVNRILSLSAVLIFHTKPTYMLRTPQSIKSTERGRAKERETDGGGKVRVALTNISQNPDSDGRNKKKSTPNDNCRLPITYPLRFVYRKSISILCLQANMDGFTSRVYPQQKNICPKKYKKGYVRDKGKKKEGKHNTETCVEQLTLASNLAHSYNQ